MKDETLKLLRMRAAVMAREPVQVNATGIILDVITFTLATETYAIEAAFVREVYPLNDFTPLPGVPSYILGIINVRGEIMPVVNLKKFFNLPEQGLGNLNKVIILRNDNMEFGILADDVCGTEAISTDAIKPLPPTVSAIGEVYLMGVTRENIIVLNAEKLLSDESMVVNMGGN
jgi:purine-binding chemotaxis protein CheW